MFTPHLAPLNRGLLSTVTLPLAPGAAPTTEELVELYRDFYAASPLVSVMDAGVQPRTASVAGTCRAQVGVAVHPAGMIVATGAIDNLGKARPARACSAPTSCSVCPRLAVWKRSPTPCRTGRGRGPCRRRPVGKRGPMTENDTFAFDPEGKRPARSAFPLWACTRALGPTRSVSTWRSSLPTSPVRRRPPSRPMCSARRRARVPRAFERGGRPALPLTGAPGPLSSTPASRTPPRARSAWKTPARPPSSSARPWAAGRRGARGLHGRYRPAPAS